MSTIYRPSLEELKKIRRFMAGDTQYAYLYLKAIDCIIEDSGTDMIYSSINKSLFMNPNISVPIGIRRIFSEESGNFDINEYCKNYSAGNNFVIGENDLSRIDSLVKFILELGEKLKLDDYYRFYHSDVLLFRDAFSRRLDWHDLQLVLQVNKYDILEALLRIEPCYIFYLSNGGIKNGILKKDIGMIFGIMRRVIESRALLYGINISDFGSFFDKNIVEDENENVEKLIRFLHK